MSLLLAVCTLFAADPTWTDKEMLIAVGSTVGTLLTVSIPVMMYIIRRSTSWYKERARKAENDLETVRRDLNADRDTGDLSKLEEELKTARQDANKLLLDNETAKNIAEEHRQKTIHLSSSLESIQSQLNQHQVELASERRRVQRALQKDGQTWTERVHSNAPDFKFLVPESRRMPVISVLNLKGGVGKTTITANLGAALDRMGYRTLLIDLDLQGSLTSLFLTEGEQDRIYREEKMLSDFLSASFGAEYPKLHDYIIPILAEQKSGLVPTTDTLAYAETNLTIRWLLRDETRDPRFLLRHELQLKRTLKDYDIVLLDCPPLINICCVNALAASDYLLIPILPSKQATARVPVLLERLKEFRQAINPALKVMGVLPNRTQRSELTIDEINRLSLLRVQCKDVWGEEVPLLETFIRQSIEVRVAEDENRTLTQTEEMYPVFLELASEIDSRLPTFCRVSARAGVAVPGGAV